jgi:hypothetical protein
MVLVALVASACDHPANHADTLIKKFNTYAILHTPPPNGVEVARASDKGSNSSVTGREPGIAVIYATTTSISSLITYYQTTYPDYHIHIDCCTTAKAGTLLGADGYANIGIDIATVNPHMPAHYDLKLNGKQPGNPTYVSVSVSGQPRAN